MDNPYIFSKYFTDLHDKFKKTTRQKRQNAQVTEGARDYGQSHRRSRWKVCTTDIRLSCHL